MKRLLLTTLALLSLGTSLNAEIDLNEPQPEDYVGPQDDTCWKERSEYFSAICRSSLGSLACYSDIIGIGVVSNLYHGSRARYTDIIVEGEVSDEEYDHFTVTVDHAIFGCTNGMVVTVYEDPSLYEWGNAIEIKNNYFPTNNSRIVFCVYTNDYGGVEPMFWYYNTPDFPWPPNITNTHYQLRYQSLVVVPRTR